jgi:hypothetical protein
LLNKSPVLKILPPALAGLRVNFVVLGQTKKTSHAKMRGLCKKKPLLKEEV